MEARSYKLGLGLAAPRVAPYIDGVDLLTPEQREKVDAEIGKLQTFFNEKLLPGLLSTNHGKYALVHDFGLVGIFPNFDAAYARSMDTFGLDAPICIAKIEPLRMVPDSLTWDFGLM